MDKMIKIAKNTMGSPANAVKFICDPTVPIWFRLSLVLLGVFSWGTLLLMVSK